MYSRNKTFVKYIFCEFLSLSLTCIFIFCNRSFEKQNSLTLMEFSSTTFSFIIHAFCVLLKKSLQNNITNISLVTLRCFVAILIFQSMVCLNFMYVLIVKLHFSAFEYPICWKDSLFQIKFFGHLYWKAGSNTCVSTSQLYILFHWSVSIFMLASKCDHNSFISPKSSSINSSGFFFLKYCVLLY
jgi:hypothetical protein